MTRIGYSIADNASNTDTALQETAREVDIKPAQQHLRCNVHSMDLMAKAIPYSTGTDCVADAARAAAQLEDDTLDDLTRWQDKSCFNMKEPLQWWRDNRHRFPVPRHLTFMNCGKSDIAAKTTSLYHQKPPTTLFTVNKVLNLFSD